MTPKQAMIADGAPKGLFLTDEQRRKAWEGVPLRQIPLFDLQVRDESAETVAFRAQEEERRRQKSLASIARMKNRFAAKAVDLTKMRWDPRRNKFVEDPVRVAAKPAPASGGTPYEPATPPNRKTVEAGAGTLTKDNAEAIAKLNGVWKDSYEKLRGTGRIVMTVGNLLKGLVKKGADVKWH